MCKGAGLATLAALLGSAVPAGAATSALNRWLPNPPSATWTYGWSDDVFSKPVTFEHYTVARRSAADVSLAWTTQDAGNGPGAVSSSGTVDYNYADTGLVNTTWSSTAPPVQFPVLCAQATQCGNSLAATHYLLIWGGRAPVLQEPLVSGARWNSLGGQGNDVASSSRYAGVERVVVPGFPHGIYAAKVVSEITQAGAIGDPYGSGTRTVWWVYGVGPVKIVFAHAGGQISTAQLYATDLIPRPRPSDRAWLPLRQGSSATYSFRNSRWLKHASHQRFTVGAVVNNTARVDVKASSGPIKVTGSYVFSNGLSGVRNLTVSTSAATRAKFPALGPRSLPPSLRRRLLTPLDFMTFGLNPIVPAFPVKGMTWKSSKKGRDHAVFGTDARSKVLGFRTVKVRAGRYRALLVETKLKQPGFAFGSGVRRSWFASGVGLVKLTFRHRDGSVSTVERLR